MDNFEIPDGYKETELGMLPEEWNIIPFSNGFIQKKGKIPSHINTSDFQLAGNYPIVDQSINSIAGYTDDETKLFKEPLPVIIFGDHTRIFKFIDFSFAIGAQGTKIFIPNKELFDPQFLFYNLSNLAIPNRGYNRHSKLLNEYSIVKPPLPEQHAIATTLRTVQEAKEKTDAGIAATKELKAAMMKHLFTYGPVLPEDAERVALKETEIGPVPEEWSIVRIGEVIQKTQYGLSIRGEQEGQYPILRMNNLVKGLINTNDLQYVNLDEPDLRNFHLNRGDILFNRTNSYELVGKTSIFKLEETFVFASYLVRIIPDFDKIFPEYLNYYLNWGDTQTRLKMLASRGVSQSNINATKLRDFTIPFPSLSIQKQIATILTAIDQKLAAEQSRKEALDTFFASLLHDLMTAKIRVHPVETT